MDMLHNAAAIDEQHIKRDQRIAHPEAQTLRAWHRQTACPRLRHVGPVHQAACPLFGSSAISTVNRACPQSPRQKTCLSQACGRQRAEAHKNAQQAAAS